MKRITFALAAACLLFAAPMAGAFDIDQLTDNDYSDWYPDISGSNIVWQGCPDGDTPACQLTGEPPAKWEVFFDNGSPTQVTNNSVHDYKPRVSGSNMVWWRGSGDDSEIYLWNGATTTQVTDNSVADANPDIDGSNVVWQQWDGGDMEIYFWNGLTTTQITDNDENDQNPRISGSNVVWHGDDGTLDEDTEIYLWDGSTITQITDNDTDDLHPDISGSDIVWEHCKLDDGGGTCYAGNWEIYRNGSPITNNSIDDFRPAISGSRVVWYAKDGSDDEIYLWNGGSLTQITNNAVYDRYPSIDGDAVVWYGCDGDSNAACTNGDYEIYATTIPPTPVPSLSLAGATLLAGVMVFIVGGVTRKQRT